MLAIVSNGELAFAGVCLDKERLAEVIISDWYKYEDDDEKINMLLGLDFSLFSSKTLGGIITEYLWAISRDYNKYLESKMFLIYGCDNPITYDFLVENHNGDGLVWTTKVDREETLWMNANYYPNLYGWDYFVDDRNIEIESDDFLLDEGDADFEWTMLEMELAAEEEELIEEDVYEEEEYSNTEDEYDEELKGLNPEEMLDYIRNRK